MANIQIKLNSKTAITLSVKDDSPQSIFKVLTFWDSEVPKQCGSCKSEDISLRHRNSKGYDFYEACCNKCGCTGSFGQYKDHSGLFFKRSDGWKKPMRREEPDSYGDTGNDEDGDEIPY